MNEQSTENLQKEGTPPYKSCLNCGKIAINGLIYI